MAGLIALFGQWRVQTGAVARARIAVAPGGSARQGALVFAAHCARCHGASGEGAFAAALHNSVLLQNASRSYIGSSIGRCRAGGAKPGAGKRPDSPPMLESKDLASVVTYIQSWRGAPLPVKRAKYRPVLGGDATVGLEFFEENCVACHGDAGVDGLAPAIGASAFLNIMSDGFMAATTVVGREGTLMSSFELTSSEIRNIIAYMRSLQKK